MYNPKTLKVKKNTKQNSMLWLSDGSRMDDRVDVGIRGPDFGLTEPLVPIL